MGGWWEPGGPTADISPWPPEGSEKGGVTFLNHSGLSGGVGPTLILEYLITSLMVWPATVVMTLPARLQVWGLVTQVRLGNSPASLR